MGNLEFLSMMQRVSPQRVCTFSLFLPLFLKKEIVSNVVNSLPGFFRLRLRVSHVEQPESTNDEFSSESDLASVEPVSQSVQCSGVIRGIL